ncbi:galactose-1-epimerase [Ideonella sp.]|uniref:galactose-1-epimerase n=1 Tax=Ideonella sp. TaxID=1929293 RepID=UPI003BB79382
MILRAALAASRAAHLSHEFSPRCRSSDQAWDLHGPEGLSIRVLGLGATWVSCRMPLPGGPRELLLGYDDEASYRRQQSYLGVTLGRYANRIGHGQLQWQGQTMALDRLPDQPHHLHGGPQGFDQRRWRLLDQRPDQLRLGLQSPDGDQGYPGALSVELSYRMGPNLTVEISHRATVTAPCPVNLSAHPYFNLDGQGDARAQQLQVAASHVLPVDGQGLPNAALAPVATADGGVFDFSAPRPISRHAAERAASPQSQPPEVYDHAFLLDPECAALSRPAAVLTAADGQVALSLYTTLPALQLYTGQHLAGGTRGCHPSWPDGSGVALEPQFLPDSPNHPEWPQPTCWLLPGEVYQHRLVYRFSRPAS